MFHRFRRPVAGASTVVAATLCLTGCTLPVSTATALLTITPTPLPAQPSSAGPTLVPTGPAPALANTGSSWAPMPASLLTYGQWLLANPAAGLVPNVAAPGCPLTGQLTTEVASLGSEGWRLAPAPLTIAALGAPSTLAPGQTTVELQVVVSRAAERIVDTNGQAASEGSEPCRLPPLTSPWTSATTAGGGCARLGRWNRCSPPTAQRRAIHHCSDWRVVRGAEPATSDASRTPPWAS